MSEWDVVDDPPPAGPNPWDVVGDEDALEEHGKPISPAASAFLNGATLGFGPALNEGMALTVPGVTYEDAHAARLAEEERLKAFKEEHPVQAGLAEGIGSGLTTAPLLGLGGAAEQAALRGVPALARFAAGGAEGAMRIPSLLFTGAKTGTEAAALQSPLSDAPMGQQLAAGASVGMAGNMLAPVLRTAATFGSKINPLVQSAVDKAKDLGVNIKNTQVLEHLPKWFRTGAGDTATLEDYTRAAGHTIGIDTPHLTGDDLEVARSQISDGYKAIEPHLNISPKDEELKAALADIQTQAGANWDKSDPAYKNVNNVVTQIQKDLQAASRRSTPGEVEMGAPVGMPEGATVMPSHAPDGTALEPPTIDATPRTDGATAGVVGAMEGGVPGARYLALTKRGGPVDQLIKNDATRDLGITLRGELDAAVERGSAPEVLPTLRNLKAQWRNTQVLEPVVKAASPHGLIDPKRLQGALANSTKLYSWNHAGDIKTLADVGQLMARPTAQGVAQHAHMPLGATIAVGGGLYEGMASLLHDPLTAAKLAATGLGVMGARAGIRGWINSAPFRSAVENPWAPASNYLVAPTVGAVNQE